MTNYINKINCFADSGTIFLGYANDLDVWWATTVDRIVVVGPEEKRTAPSSGFNFDVFDIEDGNLVLVDDPIDLHIDVHCMCQIYALCFAHKLFKENENV
jgi:hypothetical protein